MSEKKRCYFVLQNHTDSEGEFQALVAIEGERGFHETDWYWGKDFDKAEKIAEVKNGVMGISRKEANLIVLSTMRKK